MDRSGRSLVVGVALVLGLLFDPNSAQASGFATAHFGGEHGNVTESNPFALYYNPGALGFGHAPLSAILDVELALRSVSWSHVAPPPGSSDRPDSQVGNSGKATAFNAFGSPAIAATVRLENLALGVGFFVPFGGFAHWDKNDQFDAQTLASHCLSSATPCPRAVDGVARWHIIDGELSFVYFTAAVGYRLGPLSLGVSGNLILSAVRLNQAKNPSGAGLPDATDEGRISLDVSGVNGSYAAGAMLEVVPNHVWLGASYQAQPGLGPQTLTGTLDVYDAVPSHRPLTEQVTFLQALPDLYRAGARWRVSNAVELRAFGDYTRWSLMQAQCLGLQTKAKDGSYVQHPCKVYSSTGPGATLGADATGGFVIQNIPRNWNDTYGVRLGGSYWLSPDIELFAGLGYETGAVPDATLEPGLMDGDNMGAAVGARFMAWDSFYIAVSYTHLEFFDRDNTGKSQLETINGVDVAYPTAQQDGGGKYTQWIGVIDVNAQKEF
jgi:long-chain fatty acid transport protein